MTLLEDMTRELRGKFERLKGKTSRANPEYVCPECGHVTYRTLPPSFIVCVKCGHKFPIKKGESIEIAVLEKRAKIERERLCEACGERLEAWERILCPVCTKIMRAEGYVTRGWKDMPELYAKWSKYLA